MYFCVLYVIFCIYHFICCNMNLYVGPAALYCRLNHILSYLILSCLVLSCLVLSYLVLSCLVLSCLVILKVSVLLVCGRLAVFFWGVKVVPSVNQAFIIKSLYIYRYVNPL